MPPSGKPNKDPRFHYEIWSGPTAEFGERPTGIYYVENHNAQPSYDELAMDFKLAADAVLDRYQLEPDLSNWVAPVSHLVRHTVELSLKALLQAVGWRSNEEQSRLLFSHNLGRIWEVARDWLLKNGYRVREDARFETAEWFIANLHEIDPRGDLFRFGISKETAFDKQKSYDRVGIDLNTIRQDFDATVDFVDFWAAVLTRELIGIEMGWDEDPYFDPEDFPRVNNASE
jgi:hypothetical protein